MGRESDLLSDQVVAFVILKELVHFDDVWMILPTEDYLVNSEFYYVQPTLL